MPRLFALPPLMPLFLLIAGFAAPPLLAEETPSSIPRERLLISASRLPGVTQSRGSSLVISRAAIEASGARTVAELLRGLAGVTIRQNGGAGGNTEILLRGQKSGHTLVLLDGLEMADVSGIEKNFDSGGLSLAEIERIEVIKGPHSVAYGASALSGAVHIITREAAPGSHSRLRLEAGSYGRRAAGAQLSARQGSLAVSLDAQQTAISGFSSSGSREYGEADAYAGEELRLNTLWGSDDAYLLALRLRGSRQRSELDGGADDDDPNFTAKRQDWSAQLEQSFWFTPSIKTSLNGGLQQNKRRYRNGPDTLSPSHEQSSLRSDYTGERRSLDLNQAWFLSEHQALNASILWLEDRAAVEGESTYQGFQSREELPEQRVEELSYALEHQWGRSDAQRVSGQWGFRTLRNKAYGEKTVGQAALSIQLVPEQSTLNLSVGSGFKTPSLYQTKVPVYGNPELKPEEQRSAEISLEQTFENLRLMLSLYQSHSSQLIDFDGESSRYYNIEKARIRGIETVLDWALASEWNLAAQYTRLATRDEASGEPLPSRPDESWTASFTRNSGAFSWISTLRGQSRSRGGPYTQDSAGFHQLDTALRWNGASSSVNFKVSNLENSRYQEVAGYNAPGRNYLLGSEFRF